MVFDVLKDQQQNFITVQKEKRCLKDRKIQVAPLKNKGDGSRGDSKQEVNLSFLVVLPSFSSLGWGCFSLSPFGLC